MTDKHPLFLVARKSILTTASSHQIRDHNSPPSGPPTPTLIRSMYGHIKAMAETMKKAIDSVDGCEGVIYQARPSSAATCMLTSSMKLAVPYAGRYLTVCLAVCLAVYPPNHPATL